VAGHDAVRIGELLMEMLLVHVALDTSDHGNAGISATSRDLLKTYGITLHTFETQMKECCRDGSRTVCAGNFVIDFEKSGESPAQRICAAGTFKGVVNETGAIRVEYTGDRFRLVSEIANVGTDNGSVMYQVSEVVVS
jgi:hypothetical protein